MSDGPDLQLLSASHCVVLDNGKLNCFGNGPFGSEILHETSQDVLQALPTSNEKRCFTNTIMRSTYGVPHLKLI